ncbi:BLUF domain-containing protein [Caulobacter segnis]|uniref:BLUF domain-containing protein n=1 Tax=Caulobacter segnis TaxID=88688 RepID=UPI0024109643|nr:BLUF domain-containing protein [Caulobacter segnis]MDG2520638.1 BLUF domain-containing protein [Caulobacter segnis]
MLRIAYFSSAAGQPDSGALDAIISTSQRNNADLGLTGLLCHHDGSFLQFLEGEDDAVNAIFQRIVRDPRHKDVLKMMWEPAERRAFADWSMALVHVDEVGAEHQAFCSGLRQVTAGAPGFDSGMQSLLDSFRRWLR